VFFVVWVMEHDFQHQAACKTMDLGALEGHWDRIVPQRSLPDNLPTTDSSRSIAIQILCNICSCGNRRR
jgi:hypothetical protein